MSTFTSQLIPLKFTVYSTLDLNFVNDSKKHNLVFYPDL